MPRIFDITLECCVCHKEISYDTFLKLKIPSKYENICRECYFKAYRETEIHKHGDISYEFYMDGISSKVLDELSRMCQNCGNNPVDFIYKHYEYGVKYYIATHNPTKTKLCSKCIIRFENLKKPSKCKHCTKTFCSRNKLFKHLRDTSEFNLCNRYFKTK